MPNVDHYTYRVSWSEEDGESTSDRRTGRTGTVARERAALGGVGYCRQFASLHHVFRYAIRLLLECVTWLTDFELCLNGQP